MVSGRMYMLIPRLHNQDAYQLARKIFNAMDRNNDGSISLTEMMTTAMDTVSPEGIFENLHRF